MAYIYPFHPFFTLWERAIAVGNTRVRRPISLRSIRALAPAMCSFHCAHTPPQRCYCRWQYAALRLRRNNPIPHRLHRTICHSTTAPNDESTSFRLMHLSPLLPLFQRRMAITKKKSAIKIIQQVFIVITPTVQIRGRVFAPRFE